MVEKAKIKMNSMTIVLLYANYFYVWSYNFVILFSVKTLNIQRPCKWKYIEWFIFSMKCTFPLTSKGVSQASNLQKGMRDT